MRESWDLWTRLDGNDTTILSTIPMFWYFANYAHPQTFYIHIFLFTPTKWLHNYAPTSHSAATKVHNITDTPPCHTESALLMHSTASAYQIDHICYNTHARSCSHPQHNSLHMHINMHSTTHPTAFHNPPLHTTSKHKAYVVGKMAQNLGMV